jgi:hypothetical protein
MMFPRPVFVDPSWNEETSPDQTSKTLASGQVLAAGTGAEGEWPDASAPGDDPRKTIQNPPVTQTHEWDPEIEKIFTFLRGQRVPKSPLKK